MPVLEADKTECAGSEINKRNEPNLESCAQSCIGISSMFIYGTNDFGDNRCFSNGCACFCETAAAPEGTCSKVGNSGYKLYKYEKRRSG